MAQVLLYAVVLMWQELFKCHIKTCMYWNSAHELHTDARLLFPTKQPLKSTFSAAGRSQDIAVNSLCVVPCSLDSSTLKSEKRTKPNRIFLMALLINQLFLWDSYACALLQRQMYVLPLMNGNLLSASYVTARIMTTSTARYLPSYLVQR